MAYHFPTDTILDMILHPRAYGMYVIWRGSGTFSMHQMEDHGEGEG